MQLPILRFPWSTIPQKERRNLKRKPLVGKLDIYSKDACLHIGKGYVVDLNEGGLKILTRHKLEAGKDFLLRFSVPRGWTLDFLGRVRHGRRGIAAYTYGVSFLPGQGTFLLKLM
jgi:hypothetical protein